MSRAAVGEALYNLVLNEGGGVIEDLIVYRLDDERYFVVNAANAPGPADPGGDADSRVHLMYHQDWCFLAVQGPESVHVMQRLFPEASDLAFMQCVESEYKRRPVIVTRSGYRRGRVRGLHVPGRGPRLWSALLEEMGPYGGAPCGLAARDVLRLEMGYPLYRQDLFESVTALEAGLSWAVSFDKGDFRGRTSLLRQRGRAAEPARGPAHARATTHPTGHVFTEDQLIGEVTSGTFSPLLQTGIGLYLWPADVATTGDTVEVDIRGRRGVGRGATAVRRPEPALSFPRQRAGPCLRWRRRDRRPTSRRTRWADQPVEE